MRGLVILMLENMSWGESLDAKTTKIARVPADSATGPRAIAS